MDNDDYVIDENGAWNSPSEALSWYRSALAESRQTIEDVCIGTALQCPTCRKCKPCMCDK